MASTNGKRVSEPGGEMAQVVAADRFARTVVLAFEVCEHVGVPLSRMQKIAVLEAAFLEFDGFEAHLSSLASVGELLRELGTS